MPQRQDRRGLQGVMQVRVSEERHSLRRIKVQRQLICGGTTMFRFRKN